MSGLYVHVPFCLTRCGYCDFNAYAGLGHLAERYASALRREAAIAAPAWRGVRVDTVFFGGGTPTTLAPSTFGAFGGDILVGNFGNGRIHAYDQATGAFEGTLSRPHGGPVVIDGLWGLRFAPATPGAGPNTLFFTAGLNHEAHGLFGTLVPNGT